MRQVLQRGLTNDLIQQQTSTSTTKITTRARLWTSVAQRATDPRYRFRMGLLDRFRKDRPMTAEELDERSQVDGIKYRDLQLVGQLTQMGADLNAPRHVLFYLYLPDAAAAERAAAALRAAGLQTESPGPNEAYQAEHPEEPVTWPVIAESRDRGLIPDFLRETTDLCAEVAAANDGEYDGWEAGLNPGEGPA